MTAVGLDGITTYAEGLDHPEGVAVAADGTVWAGGESGQVYRIDDGSPVEICSTGGFLLGLALDGNGLVYACDVQRREVLRVDASTRTVTTYSAGAPGSPFRNPNFPVFDDAGNLYVTDSGRWKADDGDIKVIRPGGATEVWSRAVPRFPNGACLSAGGDALLVIESLWPGVSRIPIRADGSAGAPEPLCELPDTVPDGIAVDESGGFYVACYRPDRVYYVDDAGRVEVFAEDPQGTVIAAPTNVVFTGADRRTMVIGSLGRWHLAAVQVGVPGVRLRFPVLA
ncbi:MAG: gluconolactonase [Actinomycetota bacterium]|jgi:gluconolactonase|nr:gluconolactonase [Actinomycetota bacterium]